MTGELYYLKYVITGLTEVIGRLLTSTTLELYAGNTNLSSELGEVTPLLMTM